MTSHADEWHIIEVGEPFTYEDGMRVPQYELKHDCKILESGQVGCVIGSEEDFYGSDLIDDGYAGLNLTYGLYRIRGNWHTDYYGEADVDIDVERLQGPVDCRDFDRDEE